jgi:crotonobetaine/carnitine-CoA ligase
VNSPASPYDWLSGRHALFTALAWHKEARPNKNCIEMGDRQITFGSLVDTAYRLATSLVQLGVKPGDRVALYMQNCPEFLLVMLAALRVGASYSPVSTLLSDDEVGYQIDDLEPRVVFVDSEQLPRLTATLTHCRVRPEVVLCAANSAEAKGDFTRIDELVLGRDTYAGAYPELADKAIIMYTSGTTARPKGVVLDHGNLLCFANTIINFMQYGERDRILHHHPMFHMNGGLVNPLPVFMTGATLVMLPRFSASAFAHQLHDLGITTVNVNATHVRILLNTPATEVDDDHSASRMMQGLTLLPAEIAEFERRFNTRLIPTYGMTESLGINVASGPGVPPRPGASGKVLRGYEIKIVDDDGNSLSTGNQGEICIRGLQRHSLFAGYYKEEARVDPDSDPTWLKSGDVGYMDEDGFLWYVERKKDMIKRSGFNIAAAEVERVILDIPGVSASAVVGIPDPMREEAIVAFVVASGEVTEASIFEACRAKLADYKQPQVVKLVKELPTNFLGKLEKNKLRAIAMADVKPTGSPRG